MSREAYMKIFAHRCYMYRHTTLPTETTYEFDRFDYTDDFVYLAKNTVFYRGMPSSVTPTPSTILRDVPLYMSTYKVAGRYAGPNGHVVSLKLKRGIRLLDFRKVKNLVRLVASSRRPTISKGTLESLFYLSISLGLVSYGRQAGLLEEYVDSNFPKDKFNEDPSYCLVQAGIARMKATDVLSTPLNPYEPEGY